MRAFLERFDVRVSAAYGLVAALWIILSDSLIELLSDDNPPMFAIMSLLKGLGFVVVTTLALFAVLSGELRKRDRLVGTLQNDISERTDTLDALRHSEERFSKIFHASPIGISITSLENEQILDINDSYLKILGYQREELIGHSVTDLDLWPNEEDRRRLSETLQAQGGVHGLEAQVRAKSGAIRDTLVSIEIINLGGQACIVAMAQDITERKQAERAARESDERFSKIFHASPVATLITRFEDGIIADANEKFLSLTGFSREALIGHTSLDLNLYVNKAERIRMGEITKEIGGYRDMELQVRVKSGDVLDVLVSTERIELDGQPCVVSMIYDVSQRKKLEHELLQAARLQLELATEKELLKLKERFISIVSHEFRTPLAVIVSSGELVQRYHDRMTTEKQLDHITEMIVQSTYMTGLLDDILTFNKASVGKMEFNPARLDLKAFCRSAIERIESTDVGKHQFNFIAGGDLENTAFDQKLLQHIVTNLLSNAAKYSPDGGEIKLQVTRQQNEIVLQISDQGIGIPPEAQARLFEPFYRADNVGTINGTGLGLAIVKESVDLHGGTLTCQSEIGVGTTFTVQLPSMRTLGNRDDAISP